jgi:hypothetical protein
MSCWLVRRRLTLHLLGLSRAEVDDVYQGRSKDSYCTSTIDVCLYDLRTSKEVKGLVINHRLRQPGSQAGSHFTAPPLFTISTYPLLHLLPSCDRPLLIVTCTPAPQHHTTLPPPHSSPPISRVPPLPRLLRRPLPPPHGRVVQLNLILRRTADRGRERRRRGRRRPGVVCGEARVHRRPVVGVPLGRALEVCEEVVGGWGPACCWGL